MPPGRVCQYVCVTRPPWLTRHEFYVLPLHERLQAIRVPLRRTDPDAALDLQVLIDQCYERGRYDTAIDVAGTHLGCFRCWVASASRDLARGSSGLRARAREAACDAFFQQKGERKATLRQIRAIARHGSS